jgi:catechol 2,3-dioxygenase-like lactoylglutathione lyase family enzyme
MLGEHPVEPVLLATDLDAARDFYHHRLGLQILGESEDGVVFRCGGGTQLAVSKSSTGTADTQTQASWLVPDVRAEVAELRSRGVKIEDYDLPGLKTQDGIVRRVAGTPHYDGARADAAEPAVIAVSGVGPVRQAWVDSSQPVLRRL